MNTLKEMENFQVKKVIIIKADISNVWDALINPEKTKKYFFGCEVHSEWKEGSLIEFKDKNGVPLVRGTVLKIVSKRLLKYSVLHFNLDDNDDPSCFSLVTYELSYDHGETTLCITDDVGKAAGAGDRFLKSEKVWGNVLKGLKKLLEVKKSHFIFWN